MAVPDAALPDSLLEACRLALQDPELPVPHGIEHLARDEPADERLDLDEVLRDGTPDRLDRAGLRHLCGGREEAGEPGGETLEVIAGQGAAAEKGLHAPIVREPAHADRVVDDLSVGTEPVARGSEPDRDDAEVDVRRQPPVQADLVLAELPAPLDGRVVHESVVDGPLELPDLSVREEDPRDVSRDQRHRRRARIGIRLGAAQVVEERPPRLRLLRLSPGGRHVIHGDCSRRRPCGLTRIISRMRDSSVNRASTMPICAAGIPSAASSTIALAPSGRVCHRGRSSL